MRTILHILRKEFIQIFRNKTMLPIIFVVPVIQTLVLVYAATLEMKSIELAVVDKDLSATSRELINEFNGSPFYKVRYATFSIDEAEQLLKEDKVDAILHFAPGFEKDLFGSINIEGGKSGARLQLIINAINQMEASLINVYSLSIISDFNRDLVVENINILPNEQLKTIKTQALYWYNPELNYHIYMLPGILVILVTLIGMFLTALNLVREKELGTIEQVNVTPIRKYQFIAGKLIPFWLIALFELAFGLTIGKIVFDIPIEGSLLVLFSFASVYLLVVMGLGLFLSAISSSQQQVMFVAFFLMITFIMMSGIFTPVESMPSWAHKVNIINPFAYFMKAIRMILLKGSGFADLKNEFLSLGVYATIALSLAVWRYRKTV